MTTLFNDVKIVTINYLRKKSVHKLIYVGNSTNVNQPSKRITENNSGKRPFETLQICTVKILVFSYHALKTFQGYQFCMARHL